LVILAATTIPVPLPPLTPSFAVYIIVPGVAVSVSEIYKSNNVPEPDNLTYPFSIFHENKLESTNDNLTLKN
jgi:hypothetical protein